MDDSAQLRRTLATTDHTKPAAAWRSAARRSHGTRARSGRVGPVCPAVDLALRRQGIRATVGEERGQIRDNPIARPVEGRYA